MNSAYGAKRSVTLAVWVLLLWTMTFGQSVTGIIQGKVTDTKGGRIIGAQVVVSNAKDGTRKKATTNDKGYFTFAQLKPGAYTIVAEKDGYQRFEKKVILETAGRVNASPISMSSSAGIQNLIVSTEGLQIIMTPLDSHAEQEPESRAGKPVVIGNFALRGIAQMPPPKRQGDLLAELGNFSVMIDRFQQPAHPAPAPADGSGNNQGSATPQSPIPVPQATPQIDAGRLQLQSLSGERSDLITNNQVLNLALNGRDIIEFMKLMPGIVSEFNGQVSNPGGLDRFFINGTRGNQHELAIDGVSNVDTATNGSRHVTINPDAVAEMKVLTANYQAEYGKAAGGFIQIVTKSGTTEFHGSARFFHRHEGLNANGFFENTNHRPRSLYRYNSFGYDIGGPVYLPRFGEGGPAAKPLKNLFFFLNQEFYRQLIPNPLRSIRVPTLKERAGDFSETTGLTGSRLQLNVPNNLAGRGCELVPGTPFPNNKIPSECFFRDGQAILNLYPLPNVEPTAANNFANYFAQASTKYPRNETIVRLDYKLGENTEIAGRVIHNNDRQSLPFGLPGDLNTDNTALITRGSNPNSQNFDQWRINFPRPGFNVAFTVTHSFSPTLTNEVIIGVSGNRIRLAPETGQATRAANQINFPLLFPDANPGDFIPNFNYGELRSGTITTRGPLTTFDGLPFRNSSQTANFANNLTKVWNSHLVKLGVFFQESRRTQTTSGANVPDIFFSSTATAFQTGHTFANALLGLYSTYAQSEKMLTGKYRYRNVEGYVQDFWRVNDRLALDFGLRVSWYEPQYDARLQASFFDPKLFDSRKTARLYQPALVNGQRVAVDPADPSVLRPAIFIGRAVPTPDNLALLNNGFGLASQEYPRGGIEGRGAQWGPRFGFAYDLFGDGRTILRGGFGAFFDRIQGGIISDMLRNPPSIGVDRTLFNGNLDNFDPSQAVVSPPRTFGVARDGKIPTVYSFSLNFQRDIGWGTVVDVAYVGTLGRHLTQARNLNAIPYGAAFLPENQDATKLPCLVAANPCLEEPGLRPFYKAAGFKFSGSFAKDTDFLRPYRGLGEIRFYEFSGSSNYNSLQISARRRFSRNLTLSAAYTFSRAFTTANEDLELTSSFDVRERDYRLASFDRTHVFAASYVYSLPSVSEHLGKNKLAKAIFDDWQLSGIIQYSSGQPFEVLNLSTGVSSLITGSPTELVRIYQQGGVDPRHGLDGLQINPLAFLAPLPGQIAAAPRNSLRGPGINNWDISIFKNIPLGADGRLLQLRLELFNAFNHTQFSSINFRSIGQGYNEDDPNITFITRQGTYILRASGKTEFKPVSETDKARALGRLFGDYSSARSPRIIQLGAKLYF